MSCESVLPIVTPALGLLMVSVAVSVLSVTASSTTVNVKEPVVAPSAIVMVVALNE